MIRQALRRALMLAAAAFALAGPAQAERLNWSVGIQAPVAPGVLVGTTFGNAVPVYSAPVYPAPVYAPAPVYVAPAPAYYAPPPPVYRAPRVVYAPAPVMYAPPPVYVAPRPHWRHKHHHHDRGGWGY